MTHGVLGVRAERVIAHGPAPRGFLVHGGDATLWTTYLSGGVLPRGTSFGTVVRELAARAGVDTAPIDHPQLRDRRAELLEDFVAISRAELRGGAGAAAREYLSGRGFSPLAIEHSGLGLVPGELATKKSLQDAGYSELEIAQSAMLADGRWPGRLCGAWRNERGAVGTLWARSLQSDDASTRYLYLQGRTRTGLPPYGMSDVLRLPLAERRELVLVEGLIDVHRLRADGLPNVAAAGGAHIHASALIRLRRFGVESIVLAFDNDAPGRNGISRAIEGATRSNDAPTLRVIDPQRLGDAKDPDQFVRLHGLTPFRDLAEDAECAIGWRARELVGDVGGTGRPAVRRAALRRAGEWLGTLPPRFALEQEDAIRDVADRCGYSRAAVERAFHARFWDLPRGRAREGHPGGPVIER